MFAYIAMLSLRNLAAHQGCMQKHKISLFSALFTNIVCQLSTLKSIQSPRNHLNQAEDDLSFLLYSKNLMQGK